MDCLNKNGIEYNYARRCIYPLFSDLGIDFSDKKNFKRNLKMVIQANAAYCLKGDDSLYREILDNQGKNYDSLELFKGKYHAYFCEDYSWTNRNWIYMSANKEKFERWWDFVSPLVKHYALDIRTINEFLSEHTFDFSDHDAVIDTVVNSVIDNQIMTFFEPSQPSLPKTNKTKAFIRYMIGQFLIFEHFHFVESASMYKQKIMEALISPRFDGSPMAINTIRRFYREFLNELLVNNIISKDDFNTYTDVYPLFDPYFVFYDEEKGYYPELTSLYKEILFSAA
ncbi:hypothetical protein [Algicola sagamiensis]|uniref:hypothetical protein n=1 Tax=Algicola sagamiensis TaxID=163869 RepID=UPI00039D920F|nr:hypothetical protein [Algicola sagamiensis]